MYLGMMLALALQGRRLTGRGANDKVGVELRSATDASAAL